MNANIKPLIELTREEYDDHLYVMGDLWLLYPHSTGNYDQDRVVTLKKLLTLINDLSFSKDADKISALYEKYFVSSIAAEGFSGEQAEIIASEAYDQGHSAGYCEVVCVAMNLVEFAKKIINAEK